MFISSNFQQTSHMASHISSVIVAYITIATVQRCKIPIKLPYIPVKLFPLGFAIFPARGKFPPG